MDALCVTAREFGYNAQQFLELDARNRPDGAGQEGRHLHATGAKSSTH